MELPQATKEILVATAHPDAGAAQRAQLPGWRISSSPVYLFFVLSERTTE